jgi:SAM-dependent methyltransferase
MDNNGPDAYTGTDNLEILEEAVNYNRFLIELIRRHAPSSGLVMDFGAGIGTFAKKLQGAQYSLLCIEPDLQQLTKIVDAGISARPSTADIEDESVDFIYTFNVLEHIEDDSAAMFELVRVLKPGGKILIYVPAMQILYSSMDRKVGHHRRYTRRSLQALADECKIPVLACRYSDSMGYFATIVYKMLGSQDGEINMTALVIYDRLVFPISRILDALTWRIFGKNAYILLQKQ